MKTVIALSAALLAACSVRRPAYVAVPRAQSRSQEPVALRSTRRAASVFEDFLSHGGHPTAPDECPILWRRSTGGRSTPSELRRARRGHRRFLRPAFLARWQRSYVETKLNCFAAGHLFARWSMRASPADPSPRRSPFPWPVLVIFKVEDGRLIEILLVCPVERNKP